MEDSHDGALCASLGHYVAGINVGYCPHRMSYTAVIHAGDEQDDSAWRWLRLDFGPFDTPREVEDRCVSELRRLLRADLQAWKHRAERE